MPTLHIQKYFRSGKTIADLKADFGIRAKSHPKYPDLLHLSYDQIESPSGHPLVAECRGIILDVAKNWEVVAFPFRRFANYGESWADAIDWETARVTEKLDGSMIVLWFYAGAWCISTKASPDAGGPIGDFNFTFAELFWKTLENQSPDWYRLIWPYSEQQGLGMDVGCVSATYTYMFELTSPYNRIVCSYGAANKLTLIGVRENFGNFQEIPTQEFVDDFSVVQQYSISTLEDALETAEALDPIATEGFVVVDKDFHRIKIKSLKYVKLHHLRTGGGIRPMLRLIRMGEQNECLLYFPEFQNLIDEILSKVEVYVEEVNECYSRLCSITDRKAFALEAMKTKHASMLFGLHQGKFTDVRQRLLYDKRTNEQYHVTDDKLIDLLGISVKLSPFVQEV